MDFKLSILDQTPIFDGETVTTAFDQTVQLAQRAEQLGYHRYWVSEHHDSDKVAGSSPEVLISYLLAKTKRIRIGSGGVMLQHYSPYKVAENFSVLASLAPGRVDLGIGRAPGGLPLATKALQGVEGEFTKTLSEKLSELDQFLHNKIPESHPFYGLKVSPASLVPPSIYFLGASLASAKMAASHGYPYVFAEFINNDPNLIKEAIHIYRKQFNREKDDNSTVLLTISVIVAETDEEAKQFAADFKVVKLHFESGKTLSITSLEKAETYRAISKEAFTIETNEANIIYGSKETIKKKLIELQKSYDVDEIIVKSALKGFQKRLHSIELLMEAYLEIQ